MTISNYSINQFLQFGAECIIGEESIISEKTTIKDCIIGSHCLVEPKVRLTNCILMDKVTIKTGTNIQILLVDEILHYQETLRLTSTKVIQTDINYVS